MRDLALYLCILAAYGVLVGISHWVGDPSVAVR